MSEIISNSFSLKVNNSDTIHEVVSNSFSLKINNAEPESPPTIPPEQIADLNEALEQYLVALKFLREKMQEAHNKNAYDITREYTNAQIAVTKDAIISSVSSTYATKVDVTSSISDVTQTISSLQTRVNSAEQKITDSAIINTVKSEFYTKTESDSKISNSVAGLQNQNNELINRFDEAFSDSILSTYEKVQLQADLKSLDAQYDAIKTLVNQFNDNIVNGQFELLTSRYAELHEFLDPFLIDVNVASAASNAQIRELFYQYNSQYNITHTALQTFIENKLTNLTTTVTTTSQGVQTAITKSQTALDGVNTIGKHMNFTDTGWLEIFATVNDEPGPFKARISDQRFSLLEDNIEVTYLSNKQLYVTQAQILQGMQLGNIEQTKTAKGGLIFKWKG